MDASRGIREAWSGYARGEEARTARLRSGLRSIPGVRELGIFDSSHQRVSVVAFTVAALLASEFGIGVRGGILCSRPLTRRLVGRDGSCGQGPGAVRASFGLGTPEEHVDHLTSAVASIADGMR